MNIVEFAVRVKDQATREIKKIESDFKRLGGFAGELKDKFKALWDFASGRVGAGSRDASRAVTGLGRAISSLARGDVTGAARALGSFSGAFAKLSLVIGTVATAIASFRKSVIEMRQERMADEFKTMADAVKSIGENANASAASLAHMREEASRVSSARDRAIDAAGAASRSSTALEEERIGKRRADALAGVTDPEERARIEAEFQRKLDGLEEFRIRKNHETAVAKNASAQQTARDEVAFAQKEYDNYKTQAKNLAYARSQIEAEAEKYAPGRLTAMRNVNTGTRTSASGQFVDNAIGAAAIRGVAAVYDNLESGFGLWGSTTKERGEQYAKYQAKIEEIHRQEAAIREKQLAAITKRKTAEDKLKALAEETVRIETDFQADQARLERQKAERRSEKETRAKADAEADAAKEAEEAQRESERLEKERKRAKEKQLRQELRILNALEKEAQAQEKEAGAAAEDAARRVAEAKGRVPTKRTREEARAERSWARDERRLEARRERRYSSLMDAARRGYAAAANLGPNDNVDAALFNGALNKKAFNALSPQMRRMVAEERQRRADMRKAMDDGLKAQKQVDEAKRVQDNARREIELREKKLAENVDGIAGDVKSLKDSLDKALRVG